MHCIPMITVIKSEHRVIPLLNRQKHTAVSERATNPSSRCKYRAGEREDVTLKTLRAVCVLNSIYTFSTLTSKIQVLCESE